MNSCFYLAIDRLPLGTVAAIEFLPVIASPPLGARTPRNAAALALAVAGVYLLTDVQLSRRAARASRFAVANAVLFALYIVLAHRVAQHDDIAGIDGLGAAMLVAAVVVTPIGGWEVAARDRRSRSRSSPASASGCPRRSSPTSATSSRCARLPGPPTPDGVAAAGHGDGDRHVVLAQIPTPRDRGRRPRRRRGRAPPRGAGARRVYASAARTCSSCVLGDTFANTCVTFPFGSITKVDRCVPMNFRLYMDFSTHTP